MRSPSKAFENKTAERAFLCDDAGRARGTGHRSHYGRRKGLCFSAAGLDNGWWECTNLREGWGDDGGDAEFVLCGTMVFFSWRDDGVNQGGG